MSGDQNIIAELSGYENSLVKQFCVMESLFDISKRERDCILNGSTDSLMRITEEKEAALDKFSLLEESMRMFLQEMILKLRIHSERTSIQDVLPLLNNDDSGRITRLLDGISSLVEKAREMNLGNQALILTRMEWMRATKSFIVSLAKSSEGYSMPLMESVDRNTSISGMEYSA